MVEDVKEVHAEPEIKSLCQHEILLQGKIPVLLMWSAERIAAEITKRGHAGVPGRVRAWTRAIVQEWRGRKIVDIQVTVVDRVFDTAGGIAFCYASARGQIAGEGCRVAGTHIRGTC